MTERLVVAPMVWVGSAGAAASAVLGYAVAYALDVSIAGSMAAMSGVLFTGGLLMAPRRGLLAQARQRSSQRLDLGIRMLLVHVLHHQETESQAEECRIPSLHRHLRWSETRTRQVVREATQRNLVEPIGDLLYATAEGRQLAEVAVVGDDAPDRVTSHR